MAKLPWVAEDAEGTWRAVLEATSTTLAVLAPGFWRDDGARIAAPGGATLRAVAEAAAAPQGCERWRGGGCGSVTTALPPLAGNADS